jgi:hypothetical protein
MDVQTMTLMSPFFCLLWLLSTPPEQKALSCRLALSGRVALFGNGDVEA